MPSAKPDVGCLDWLDIREVPDGRRYAEPMFQRCYRQAAPDLPLHVLAFSLPSDADPIPVCYIHFSDAGEYLLGGGACVDSRALRRILPAHRAALRAMGGLYAVTLQWSLRNFGSRYRAIFGYCGDVLAERIDLAAGFERTMHPHLLIYSALPLFASERADLIAQAHAAGPF